MTCITFLVFEFYSTPMLDFGVGAIGHWQVYCTVFTVSVKPCSEFGSKESHIILPFPDPHFFTDPNPNLNLAHKKV